MSFNSNGKDFTKSLKATASPILSKHYSQCGKKAYIRLEDAQKAGAKACFACGLYHAAKGSKTVQ